MIEWVQYTLRSCLCSWFLSELRTRFHSLILANSFSSVSPPFSILWIWKKNLSLYLFLIPNNLFIINDKSIKMSTISYKWQWKDVNLFLLFCAWQGHEFVLRVEVALDVVLKIYKLVSPYKICTSPSKQTLCAYSLSFSVFASNVDLTLLIESPMCPVAWEKDDSTLSAILSKGSPNRWKLNALAS